MADNEDPIESALVVKSIETARLEPGDVIVLTVPRNTATNNLARFERVLSEVFLNRHRVIVLLEGSTLSLVKPAVADEPSVERNVV